MNYKILDNSNISSEHLCCALSDKKHECGVELKKQYLRSSLKNGHVFRKLDVSGKVFIEYEPLKSALVPVEGDDYLYIYCLWVAGSHKSKGYGKNLLEYAINDAKSKGLKGLCTLSSKKKKPFISEKSFFEKYEFKVVDTINDYELLCLTFEDKYETPKFSESSRLLRIDNEDLTIYYSDECPYIYNCLEEIKDYCNENSIRVDLIKIEDKKSAKNIPSVFNNWSVFYKKQFITTTLLNKNSLEKLLKSM